jgi:hypothetical protein
VKDFREMTKEEKEAIFAQGVKQALKEHHTAGKAAILVNE